MTSLKASGEPKSSVIQARSVSCTSLNAGGHLSLRLSFSDREAFVLNFYNFYNLYLSGKLETYVVYTFYLEFANY
jgi:hypothetical protein